MALKKNPLSKKEAGKIEHTHKLHYFGRKMLDSDFHSNFGNRDHNNIGRVRD